jgi:hypothetical protein
LFHVNVEWGYLTAVDDGDGEGDVGAGAHAHGVNGAKDGTKGFVVGR